MQTIKLTGVIYGRALRVFPEHIVAYGPTDSTGSEVILTVHNSNNCVQVKESPEEIDKLLSEAP